MAAAGSFIVGLLVLVIVSIIIILFETIGAVRFARTGSIGEAFNFSAILERIGKIGWGSYIIALIVIAIIAAIIAFILMAIPVIGWLLFLIVIPALVIFVARFICLVYDSVPAETQPASPPAT
jgi:hypothetical protein